MRIVIIEDEIQAAFDLQKSIKQFQPTYNIAAILDSVESAVEWFTNNRQPDIIFSDIQLGDGLAFDIFKKVIITCPVIFCTAYDEYAMEAFRNNGIDYLLKPVTENLLKSSLDKIKLLKKSLPDNYNNTLHSLLDLIESNKQKYRNNFLISFREKWIPINTENIAFFKVVNGEVELYTKDGKQYTINFTLDYLESVTDRRLFFRANRQYLLSFNAIKEIEQYYERKLLVRLLIWIDETVIVSKAKAQDFLVWMQNR